MGSVAVEIARHPPKTYYPIGPTSKEHRFFIINIAFIEHENKQTLLHNS